MAGAPGGEEQLNEPVVRSLAPTPGFAAPRFSSVTGPVSGQKPEPSDLTPAGG